MPDTLAARIREIRLPRKAIAESARITANTVSRVLNQRNDPRLGTHTAIEQAVATEEIRLRDYLLARHPIKDEAA